MLYLCIVGHQCRVVSTQTHKERWPECRISLLPLHSTPLPLRVRRPHLFASSTTAASRPHRPPLIALYRAVLSSQIDSAILLTMPHLFPSQNIRRYPNRYVAPGPRARFHLQRQHCLAPPARLPPPRSPIARTQSSQPISPTPYSQPGSAP